MQDPNAQRAAALRIHITDKMIGFLSTSTAAGNGAASVSLAETSCPQCSKATLSATAKFRSSTVTNYVRHRQFEIVIHCKAHPCTFVGNTTSKFTLTG